MTEREHALHDALDAIRGEIERGDSTVEEQTGARAAWGVVALLCQAPPVNWLGLAKQLRPAR